MATNWVMFANVEFAKEAIKKASVQPFRNVSFIPLKSKLFVIAGNDPLGGIEEVILKAERMAESQKAETIGQIKALFKVQDSHENWQGMQLCLNGKYPGRHLLQIRVPLVSFAQAPQLVILHPAGVTQVLFVASYFPSLQLVQFFGEAAHVKQLGSHKKHLAFESNCAGATQTVQAGLPSDP